MPDLNTLLAYPDMTAGDLLSQYGSPYGNGMFSGQGRSSQSAPSAMAALGSQDAGGSGWGMPLDRGGIFGQQKWMPGNGIDIFTRRGAPVYAMFDGTLSPYGVPGPGGQIGGMLLQGDNGYTMQSIHTQLRPQGAGRVRKGDVIGYVGDPTMDMLGPYQGMPDGFQHLDLTIGRGRGPFPLQGGDINASQWLQQNGYGSPSTGQTRGPNGAGGGGMGGGMPGMGMPGMGGGPMGMGGLPGMGMPGMPGMGMGGPSGGMFGGPGMGMSGMPGMGMPGMPGMGMSPMFGGGNPFGGMGGGMMGLPPMPPMFGGGAYPVQGFGGLGQFGMQQGIVPNTPGVGIGMLGGGLGPVTGTPGTYSGPSPVLPIGPLPNGGGLPGLGSPFGGFGLGSIFG